MEISVSIRILVSITSKAELAANANKKIKLNRRNQIHPK